MWNKGTGSHLGRLRPPKRLTGTKCIKMLSPIIANQWDEENDVHFYHGQSAQSYVVAFGWERVSKSQSMVLQSGTLAIALKDRLDTFGPRNQQ